MNTKNILWAAITIAYLASTLTFGVSMATAQESGVAVVNRPKWNYEELTKAPEKARAVPNPFAGDPNAIRAGGKLFDRHCAGCHGMKAEGGKRAPSLLRKEVQQATPGALFWVLSNGVVWRGMPVWSNLPEPQRWQIVEFLESFRNPSNP
jgi:mono/diheme cytochrome c family protein